jgi:speckle-type POZ protein
MTAVKRKFEQSEMSFTSENNESLKCVKWKIGLANMSSSSHDKLPLTRFNSISYLNVSCTYDKISIPNQAQRYGYSHSYDYDNQVNQVRKYQIEISLQHVDGISDDFTPEDKSEIYKAIPDYYCQPCDVWVIINNCEEQKNKHQLKKLSDSQECWKSDKFVASFNQQSSLTSYQLQCEIRIKFQSFGIGEMKALKTLTDYFYFQQANWDIKFEFEDGQHICGHKNILSARSPVFAAMFSHDLKETSTGRVRIEDFQLEIFKELMHFIYLGRTQEPLKNDNAQPLYEAADKYDIVDLKQDCGRFLLNKICLENAIDLLIWADHNSANEIKEEALKLVVSNGKAISKTKEWEQLTKNYPDLCITATRRMLDLTP